MMHVFIDTSTYEGLNFDWQGKLFQRLMEHIQEGRATLHCTSITQREVERRLKKYEARAKEAKSRLDNACIGLGGKKAPVSVPKADEAVEGFQAFLGQSGATIHSASLVSCDELADRHFREHPPFSSKKPNEFLDAIAGMALRQWAEETDVSIRIVSDDKDWKAMSMEFNRFEYSNLAQALGELESQRVLPERIERLKEMLEGEGETLENLVCRHIEELDAYLEDHWEDEAEVLGLSIDHVEFDEVSVVHLDLDTNSAEVVLSGRANISAEVTFGDEDSYCYDSEEKIGWFYRKRAGKTESELFFRAEVEVDIAWQSGELDIHSLSSNLGSFLAIDLDDLAEDYGEPD